MDRRQLHFNAFLMNVGHHEAAWRLPESDPFALYDVAHWQNLAQIAERAALDSIFLADSPGLFFSPEHRPAGALEPTILLTSLASVTSRIGLIGTASTTYNEPYNLARRFASLDHVSGGRAGWNIVTTAESMIAQNFGLVDRPTHRDRYERATEFVEVCLRLWDSWDDGAVLGDKEARIHADVTRIRPVNHDGRYFRVRGPLNLARCPQGHPLLVQAGSSPDGRAFAARYGEAIFTAQQALTGAQAFYADLKERAHGLGRDPGQVKILPGLVPVIGSTEAEARAINDELEDLIIPQYGLDQLALFLELPPNVLELDKPLPPEVINRPLLEGAQSKFKLVTEMAQREGLSVRQLIGRLGAGRGHLTFVGTPEQAADMIQDWFQQGGADGFNLMPATLPSGLERFTEHVIPILQQRGLFRREYAGSTLREHYGVPRPESRFAMVPGSGAWAAEGFQ